MEASVKLPDSVAAQCGTTHLPTNIQHQYGSSVCRSLFSYDEDGAATTSDLRPAAEATTIEDEETEIARRPRLVLDPAAPGFHYDTLGNIMRANVCRGSSVSYDRGVTQTDYNEAVFERRQPAAVGQTTNQHPKRRDDYSKWAEQNIIWTRQRKAWDTHRAERKAEQKNTNK